MRMFERLRALAGITIGEGAPTTTPASGEIAIYGKSNGRLYKKDDAGAEILLDPTFGDGLYAPDSVTIAVGAGTGITVDANNVNIADGGVTNIKIATGIAGSKIDAATTSARGTVELATDGEATTGTDTTRAITPANLAAVLAAYGPLTDSGWVSLTLGNGWTNTGSPYHNAAYRKIGNCVYLRGVITAGTYAATIATLPSGFRPTDRLILSGGSAGITSGAQSAGTAHTHAVGPVGTRFDIQNTGVITAHGNLAGAYLSLDGVSFLNN